jgi:transcriptional regulator with XRE-family HTH domain
MERRKIATPSELGRRSGVDQSLISRWLRDGTQPTVPALRRLAPVLGASVLELLVVAGHLEPDEVDLDRLPAAQPVDEADVVDLLADDPTLSPESREHIVRQYRILQRYSAAGPHDEPGGQDEVSFTVRRGGHGVTGTGGR